MDEGVAAVRRHFPARAKAIDVLAARSEDFREICRDFADAGLAVEKWSVSADPKRVERIAEYRELIAELLKEIEGALDIASTPPPPR
ncbi:hypothetical protein [Rhizobium bangladeshense]|uniref:hypothetical protein n=1 Tax=Rhizobium bangladeshense TaxID=1138189 RepID=UPI001C82E4D5|nr:hypothetical protein [Rhizobium bangladeshense]MBX4888927.1 hypothetical protein [Rhizobium bangladeshense]MBX4923715.1 hypothetical protein [Rhizobium bangladeshense]